MVTDFKEKDGFSNTRPERTEQHGLRVLVDWVSCTFSMETDFEQIQQVLGIEELEMQYNDWGRNTFKEHVIFSNIIIQRKEQSTYQLSLSGQGCREFEQFSKYNWLELIAILKDFTNCKFTRLDLAIDDFQKHFTVSRIRNYLEKGLCITRLEEYESKNRYKVATGQATMDSIYLGSMSSRLSINFYDKKLERDAKEKESDGSWDSWTRTELRLKREYADQAADMILLYNMDLGRVAFGLLSKNIRFVKKHSSDKNIRRRQECIWWLNYIGKVDKLKFSLEAPDRTIEKSKQWFGHAVAPTIAAIQESDPKAFQEWLLEMLEQGKERMNDKHEMMLKQDREMKIKQAKQIIKDASTDTRKTLHQDIYTKNKAAETLYRQQKKADANAPTQPKN